MASARHRPASDDVATANAGCLLQIRRFLDAGVPVVHPAQLLDASITAADVTRTTRLASLG
ncbi:hypothetical protein [Lentzea kentuckyensis]|uniref:hypothetical protein n=1 Tax=Lentzea kentuckyensis TaxID=360086 RepID=UPI000A39DBA2|nr:hypothetical protein [Lentzea kentuckyensis]